MRLFYALAVSALLLLGLPPAGKIALLPPAARSVREVIVFGPHGQVAAQLAKPGEVEVEFPCAYFPSLTERVTVKVSEMRPGEAGSVRWLPCTPARARQVALQGERNDPIEFTAPLEEAPPRPNGAPDEVTLADGTLLVLEALCRTPDGPYVLVPAAAGEAAYVLRTANPGEALTIRGWPALTQDEEPCLIVEELLPAAPPSGAAAAQDRPWTVSVQRGETELLRTDRPGDYPLRIPCSHRTATESVGVRLRQVRVVDLTVGGHAVTAELAHTRAQQSWGVQGRTDLGPNEGMIFFWPEPLQPIFIMKTVSFPLSVAFVRADGTIVTIKDMQPGDQRGVTSSAPVNYVIEMRQGWFAEHGVEPGARVEFR